MVSLFPKFLHANCRHIFIYLCLALYICMTVLYLRYIWLYSILVKLSGDVEENPGPKPKPCQSFSICHWNVNSVSAHNFSKVSLLRAYVSIHKFDVICMSETFLNPDAASDDDNLKTERYNIVRPDHPSNSKRAGVCIYYNHSLALKILDIKYLQVCIVFQVLIADKPCNFISSYRSSSQPTDIFDEFTDNIELPLDEVANHNLFLVVVLGDFNVKSENWYKQDKTSYKGAKIDTLTTQLGLQQIVKGPAHLLAESFSCIDLIFKSHQTLVMEPGAHSSLHLNCHHLIIEILRGLTKM